MTFIDRIKHFANDEDGAVTVDWVVLTAAIVGLGIAVLAAVGGGVQTVSQGIASELTTDIIQSTFTT